MILAGMMLSSLSAPFASAKNEDLVHVNAELLSDHKDPKSGKTEIIEYRLQLNLTNHFKSDTGPIKVRVIFNSRDLATGRNGIEQISTTDISIRSRGNVEIFSDPVTFKFTPEHSKPLPPGRHRALRSKRIPASGQKYTGYSVQVFRGNKVIGEKLSAERFRPTLK